MMKKIVLFSDGTGNSSAKAQKTNVWRLFQALDQTTPDQLAKYDDGVGSSSNKYLAAIGGAFGYGLKRNLIDLYKFVCWNYEPGDEIYGFGFSRGAFTIRMLVGLICTQGLVSSRSESELHANALTAYRRYRSQRFKSWSPFVWIARGLRDLILGPWTQAARKRQAESLSPRTGVPIKFLGLWDTVGAYGMPIDELKWGISMLIWPMASVDRYLFRAVERACHALSLDDQRETFHPILFDEAEEARRVALGTARRGRLAQVWFAGVHSNVGGGYPEDQQSLVSLDWMISQAQAAGLRLDATAVESIAEDRSAYARLYDSRAGVMAYYRYSPRKIDLGCDPHGVPIKPIVHGSVVMRMAAGSDAYAPISLPVEFDVLAPDGSFLAMRGFEAEGAARTAGVVLPPSTTAVAKISDRTKALKDAISALGPPDTEMVPQVLDTVWWRRVTYFACLFFTLCVVAFPFVADTYSRVVQAVIRNIPWLGQALLEETKLEVHWFNTVCGGWIKDLVAALKGIVPTYANRWLDALAARPLEMIVALILVAIPFAAGNFLAGRVHDRAWFAWHPDERADYLDWLIQSARSAWIKAAVLLAITAAVLIGVTFESSWTLRLRAALGIALVGLLLALCWRIAIARRLRRDSASIKAGTKPIPATPTLMMARWLRHCKPLGYVYWLFAEKLIPIAFALALIYGVAVLVNHALTRAASSAGLFCKSSATADASPGGALVNKPFDTRQLCWASGFAVKSGRRYAVTLTAAGNWLDGTSSATVAGISSPSIAHVLGAPLKRSWDLEWFQPIVRVGLLGDDEYVIQPSSGDKGQKTAQLTFKAAHDGELFLYVNDAIAMLPWGTRYFYHNNQGTSEVRIQEIEDPPNAR